MLRNQNFRLRKIKISGHPVLKTLDITLCDDSGISSSIYTTGIIGANGTGKSHLMGAIAYIFSDINKAVEENNSYKKRFSYTIEYNYGGNTYCISNMLKIGNRHHDTLFEAHSRYDSLWATCNEVPIQLQEVMLPEKVIASTMTVTDKFVAKSDNFYRYKGIRNERSASSTGTRTIIRKTVESLMDCMNTQGTFHAELKILLNKLGLENHINISYSMRYKELFLRPDMNVQMLRNIFDNWRYYFPAREHEPWGFSNYIRGLKDNAEALKAASKFLAEKSQFRHLYSKVVNYDLIADPESFRRDAFALRVLTQLDLISFPSINVVKQGSSFGFENSSSGETHLLCQFIGIMADVRHNSLVLIDEPENSSHPEWQMNYVGWLKEIFSDYDDCHFIIATHSPLILANMKASESKIVRLYRGENNKIGDEGGMEKGCFSWTIEEILQDVMKMKSCRTDEYDSALADFEKAVDSDDKRMAQVAYERIIHMIRPGNVLAELLNIQMIGLNND